MGKKLTKGQKLYYEDMRRRSAEREVAEVTVATVGSKYFTLEEDGAERYVLATLRAEYGQRQLHLTEQEIRDEWARVQLARALRNVFDYTRVPLAVLQEVAALVPEQLSYLAKQKVD